MTKQGLVALALVSLAAPGAARADGAGQVVAAGNLDSNVLGALRENVSAARKADPEAFAALAAVRGHRPEAYLRTRLRKPNLAPELRALGARGLWPMVEALVQGLGGAGAVNAAERKAIEVGLLDAVGVLGDPRAEAVLAVAFEHKAAHVVATAALGLGRLCSGALDAALAGKRGAFAGGAALRALGECRRPGSIARLAEAVRKRKLTGGELQAAAEALGKLGGGWALEADVLAQRRTRAEAGAMRAAAARALADLESEVPVVTRKDAATVLAITDARAMIEGK